MKIGNAPVSWGIFEVDGLSSAYSYRQVMDEIAAAGYFGTELGPLGFYPTDPDTLRAELNRRGLTLASAFCPVDLTAPATYPVAEGDALRVGALLQALGVSQLILADPMHPRRAAVAGWATASDELPKDEWSSLTFGLNRLGARLAETGLKVVFHHHAATYVETESEINRLLDRTDPALVGLCLDTGHAVYGGADPVALLHKWRDRVHYVHLKDVDLKVLATVQAMKLDYETAVRRGIFCPLGQGAVDFTAFFAELRAIDYTGWVIVEQDVILDNTGVSVGSLEAARRSLTFLRGFVDLDVH